MYDDCIIGTDRKYTQASEAGNEKGLGKDLLLLSDLHLSSICIPVMFYIQMQINQKSNDKTQIQRNTDPGTLRTGNK